MSKELDALDQLVQKAFVRTNTALGETHADVVAVASTVQALVDLLVARGVIDAAALRDVLPDATRRLEESELGERLMVRTQELYRDKYQEPNAPVDCDARMPVCKGACCGCRVPLSSQDVAEGVVKWDLARPYYLRQSEAGRCVHQELPSGRCGVYEKRPLPCRSYTCRNDARIWRDFEKMIPNEKGIRVLLEGRAERPIVLRGHKSAVPTPVADPNADGDDDG
jgi:Fe-S-cluster containining protein